MPRIRKETSRRGTTNNRKKIQNKVRETRKKRAKAAKKNPQWKSKHKKDPGIPNNFPYKDQILAEVAEQRRLSEQEKQNQKDSRKLARAKKSDNEGDDENELQDNQTPSEGADHSGADGIASITAKHLIHAKTQKKAPAAKIQEEEEEEQEPLLFNPELSSLQAVLDLADVVIQVLDARDPLSFRSSHLESLVTSKANRRMVFVLSKIDLCPRESVQGWLNQLREEHPTFPFSANDTSNFAAVTTGKGKSKAQVGRKETSGSSALLSCLLKWSKENSTTDRPFTVAVIGLTNVGKSTLVNSFLSKAILPTYSLSSSSRGPTTTEFPQELTVELTTGQVSLIDTPGLSWVIDDSSEGARPLDILLRSKGRIDRLKDPIPPVAHIVSSCSAEDLMLLYSLPAFTKGNTDSFLSGVARSNQLVKKHGELDLSGAARIVLKDWSTGKFARFASPPSNSQSSVLNREVQFTEIYEQDASTVNSLHTRKEMRRSQGIIKMDSGKVDHRKVQVEMPWNSLTQRSKDHSDDDEDSSVEVDEEEDTSSKEEEEEEEEEEMEEEPTSILSAKQKRKAASLLASAPPSKKVAFATDPKSSKQARSVAGARKVTKPTAISKTLVTQVEKLTVNSKVIASKGGKNSTTQIVGEEEYDFTKFF